MRVLSLDIGVTTGWALIDNIDVWAHGTIPENSIASMLFTLIDAWKPDFIVAERPIIMRSKLGDRLQKIIAQVDYRCNGRKGFQWVEASGWKDSPFRTYGTPRGTSQHEKDAIRMGHWYYDKISHDSN